MLADVGRHARAARRPMSTSMSADTSVSMLADVFFKERTCSFFFHAGY
jgi:hypothetical protein